MRKCKDSCTGWLDAIPGVLPVTKWTFVIFILTAMTMTNRKNGVNGSKENIFNLQHANITALLNSLLEGYNKHLRPNTGGPPVEILTNILIRSMGPVSEELMMFSLDCYFRQNWVDQRLQFSPMENITELRPSVKMLDDIWKPDTFFLNGQDSYLHTITYYNKLFRIQPGGEVLYSQRLTIKSSCPMDLKKYPMDTQMCPLLIGSFAYSSAELEYRWVNSSTPVKKYKDITMAQFKLTDIEHGYKTEADNHGRRKILWVEFSMRREPGFYLLQIYMPCYLIVIISWVSFWINREATPARVMLGITTLLTTCTIAITGRSGIPKVSYSTALDIFLLLCFLYVFAALVEYAGVNYFTKNAVGEAQDEDDDDQDPRRALITNATYTGRGLQHTVSRDINGHTVVTTSTAGITPETRESCWDMFMHCLKGNTKYKHFKSLSKTATVSVSKIDSLARIIFPFSFTCLNILYWSGYLYYF